MKRKIYILGVFAALCLSSTGYYAWTLYDAYCKQVAEWNKGAKAAFEEALWVEVNKRAEVPIRLSSSGEEGITTLKERIPDTVWVTSASGRNWYQIERFRYENSLIKETINRARLSTLLEMYPLSVETLSFHWDSILNLKQYPIHGESRYIYTDFELQNDTIFSSSDKRMSHLDSLTVKYLGFRCEHEVVAYISYPNWMASITGGDRCLLLLPWILLALFFVFYPKLETLVIRKLTHNEVIERTIVVEKKIHVADVSIDKAQVYQLPDGSLFDSFSGTVTRGDSTYTLPPQSALLLRLFLRAKNHRLSTVEIEQELWNGNGSTDKIYKVIQRLRVELKKVPLDLVIKNVNGDYELK